MSSKSTSKSVPKLSLRGGENSTKVPRYLWKMIGMGACGVELGKKEGATFWSLQMCELLCFTRLFAGGYKVFSLFEISLKHTLEGFAVASFVVVFVGTE